MGNVEVLSNFWKIVWSSQCRNCAALAVLLVVLVGRLGYNRNAEKTRLQNKTNIVNGNLLKKKGLPIIFACHQIEFYKISL